MKRMKKAKEQPNMNIGDWRLTNQMDYLFQKKLIKKQYKPFREGWEHDHCEFCGSRIDTSVPFAYATEDNYHWICEECCDDFKEIFKWTVVDETTSKE